MFMKFTAKFGDTDVSVCSLHTLSGLGQLTFGGHSFLEGSTVRSLLQEFPQEIPSTDDNLYLFAGSK